MRMTCKLNPCCGDPHRCTGGGPNARHSNNPPQWDSGSPSFNEHCLAYIELMGQDAFDVLLERYVLWGDRPVPRNVLHINYPRVYRDMAKHPLFIEGLYRTGRRGMALQIVQEAAQ